MSEEVTSDIEEALDRAMAAAEDQMNNPDLYADTPRALMRISGLAAYLHMQAANYRFSGESKKATFVKQHAEALELIVGSLKYKINAGKAIDGAIN